MIGPLSYLDVALLPKPFTIPFAKPPVAVLESLTAVGPVTVTETVAVLPSEPLEIE